MRLILLTRLVSTISVLTAFSFAATTLGESASNSAPRLIGTYALPRTSLSNFANPPIAQAALDRAIRNGLKFSDLPSIGSGLAKAGTNEFWGITDRGPNGTVGRGDNERRTFPLPEFCPTIVRFQLDRNAIQIRQFISLSDGHGRAISGLSNLESEDRLYNSADRKKPLPLDSDGIDPEAIRVLPGGNFLLSEENSPSILVISAEGRVLMRYTPISKPLPNATYPVKAILPDIFAQRRSNKGFENLAVSRDGRFAYAILQSAMGDESKKRFAGSRIIRALKLDLTDPLNAKVAGEYLVRANAAKDYSAKQKQESVSWSDADWIAPDQLLVVERAKGEAKLLLIDLTRATNILGRRDEPTLAFEDAKTVLARLNVQPATAHEVFSTRDLPGIDSDKIEGVAILNATDIALTNDNDFGIGDNETGEPSKLWIVRLAEPLALDPAGR